MKNCLIFGDSISTTNFSRGGYEEQLRLLLGAEKMINHAQNAAALTSGYPFSVCDEVTDSPQYDDVDVVIVWAGTNDWFYGVPLGEPDGRLCDNFCGSLRKTMLTVSERYPKALAFYVTPVYRYSEYDGETVKFEAFDTKNAVGCTLYDYYKCMKEVSERVGFAVCDMRTVSGINKSNHTTYLRDGVHPTEFGYKRIANILCDFIKKFGE